MGSLVIQQQRIGSLQKLFATINETTNSFNHQLARAN